ncbi:MAG: ABC transporter substrate-binding protein [Pseudodesulfovibrio sp.]|uniref:Extracellular solute-binding protein family 1 n=1 Tax=Pseudodesulfovibrio aespoeensis (strain ATCC 700646 / DSM 10631 / Aspo-2) TaxID=643562 RepID=E6VYZ2_PSEA9|nr:MULTISPECIES: ABC transporter substrate-binding protein [Pseudodesulfovibrio]MBU4474079.1 ABC transporter substrate-binding protein [Pseudomonadota bacterium]ADU61655.1 extracellular solute-binding protein family 1 [Pseudodesulfovibrio aespoeensis Aspo-2]MBU4517754.1 ABC transporter substrate-binding protein [Pseudomonadota bacterium]MBU4522186.1 ABC transporter substrate-binding protein [Pseudomonadota bacterium]MBU4559086.1 ABC transporter substrate-binding protein [Pseudomonadota bacteri
MKNGRIVLFLALAVMLISSAALAATKIDFMFPSPVQGKLAKEMTTIVSEYNKSQSEVEVRGIFTGDYDTTKVKAEAASKAGNPPALVIMMANLIPDLAINGFIAPIQTLSRHGNVNADTFLAEEFWPALRQNASFNGEAYGIPFHNSTPVMYYNKTMFKKMGITVPTNWAEVVEAAKKIANPDEGRWGIMLPSVNTDYCGWILSSLVMANGGQYYNSKYPGEVYYTAPTTVGAMTFWRDLVFKHKVMPQGVLTPNTISSTFFAGKLGMAFLSTGALGHMRDNSKDFELGVAFMPTKVTRGVIIGGASLVTFNGISEEQQKAAWKFMSYLTSPEVSGRWSRFTGYFAPRIKAYDLPEMTQYLAEYPDAKTALDQLKYAQPWYSTYETIAVRKAMENNLARLLNDPDLKPADAARDAQKEADEILAPYVEKTALQLP